MTDETKEITVVSNFGDVLQEVINESQYNIIRGRTPKKFIKVRPGKGGKNFSYVPHGYVTSILNNAFGFDWDWEIVPMSGEIYRHLPEEVMTDKHGKEWTRPASIIVHGRLTVRVRDPKDPGNVLATITKTSSGEREVIKGMTWGGMIKSAESDAFKKAASRLGVALDLYWEDPTGEFMPEDEEQVALRKNVQRVMQENPNISVGDLANKLEITIGEADKLMKEV